MKPRAMSLLAALCWVTTTAAAPLQVRVDGRVGLAGARAVSAGTRLDAVALKAGVQPDAYMLGAAWMRASLRPQQRRLKAGLLFDLRVLAGDARLRGDDALAALAGQWQTWLGRLPVTGRETGIDLDPRTLEIARVDPRVGDGDRLYYPPRAHSVRVVGAVRSPCVLAFVPMQAALDYRRQCATAAAASPDWLYVIQPDGTVHRRGIGPWNRDLPVTPAPGAIIYIPIRDGDLSGLKDPSFNAQVAAFLATQPLPETGR